ncbi:transcriptional regulator [Novosphingobium sp. BL-52-GroH]|uniref:transcriptional regulator n=1 Tax=Novosphingobium sp. BL-52-GroH TaxID=3349877 RepID=UPI00384EE98F
MLTRTNAGRTDPAQLDEIKTLSGRLIEERRKRLRMTQGQLALKVGVGVRWLREIEAGNPKSTMENHMRCAFALGMSASNLFVPALFSENNIAIPFDMLVEDPAGIKSRCLECIADYCMEALSVRLGRPIVR